MGYEPRDAEEVRDPAETVLNNRLGDPALQDADLLGSIIAATAQTIADQQEQTLSQLADQSSLLKATGEDLTRKAREYGIERRVGQRATGVVQFERSSPAGTDYVIAEGTRVTTRDNSVTFKTTEQVTISDGISKSDSTTYSTSNTSYTTVTSFDVDVTYRDSLDVQADIRTTNSSYTTSVKIADATNSNEILSTQTTNTSFTTKGPTSYDVSSVSGTITIEYRIKIGNSSGSAELTNAQTDVEGQRRTQATARATEVGPDGNLPSGTLVEMPSPPTGVETVTNPEATGDPTNTDTNGNALLDGTPREDDEELRDRTLKATAIGGAAHHDAIETAVLTTDGVESVGAFPNATNSTDSDGHPPYSVEVIVLGGTDAAVAEALFDVVAVTELYRLQGGDIGTAASGSVYSDLTDSNVTVDFSRPVKQTLDITTDVDIDGSLDPDTVKRRLAEYIGGERPDGETETGIDFGSDVFVDRVENAIVAEETNVIGIASLTIDKSGNGSDDTTTNADGIDVVSMSDGEKARVEPSTITINTV